MRLLVFILFVYLQLFAMNAFAFYNDGLMLNSTVMNFDFAEYDQTGEVVSEKGLLAGGELQFGYSAGPVWGAIRGSFLKGVADYVGQTAFTNDPHKTQTDETIYDFELEIGRNYETWRRHDFATIYAGIGLHQWVRDIKTRYNEETGSTVIGLFERYTWMYANVGARGLLFATQYSHTMIEINLLRTVRPILDISFKGNYDDQRVYLGEHYGAKISIPWRYEMTRRVMLYAEVYFEAWDLGFSEITDITKEGFVADATQEPRSKSRFSGLNLGLFLRFD